MEKEGDISRPEHLALSCVELHRPCVFFLPPTFCMSMCGLGSGLFLGSSHMHVFVRVCV